ncbi:hypothetical protein ONS96_011038, partial [Cadophora gregata f. sp. sojae]
RKCCREVSECPRSAGYPYMRCCRRASSTACSDGSPFNTLGECVQSKTDFKC